MNEHVSLVFLVSGNGGTLKFFNEFLKHNDSVNFHVQAVIGDRECDALTYANGERIPNQVVPYNKKNRGELLKELMVLNPDFVVTNIYKILDAEIVERFPGRLINFHYSLLPAFKGFIGMDTLQEALKLNCRFIGSTGHYVNQQVDSGKIICQSVMAVPEKIDETNIQNTIFRSNCLMALNTFHIFSSSPASTEADSANILGNKVYFSPSLRIIPPDENFWRYISEL